MSKSSTCAFVCRYVGDACLGWGDSTSYPVLGGCKGQCLQKLWVACYGVAEQNMLQPHMAKQASELLMLKSIFVCADGAAFNVCPAHAHGGVGIPCGSAWKAALGEAQLQVSRRELTGGWGMLVLIIFMRPSLTQEHLHLQTVF